MYIYSQHTLIFKTLRHRPRQHVNNV